MKCVLDASGVTHRHKIQHRNSLTSVVGAQPAFAMNITYVFTEDELSDPPAIEDMEEQLLARLHDALDKNGFLKGKTIEIEI